jgi:hypothetical protein
MSVVCPQEAIDERYGTCKGEIGSKRMVVSTTICCVCEIAARSTGSFEHAACLHRHINVARCRALLDQLSKGVRPVSLQCTVNAQ